MTQLEIKSTMTQSKIKIIFAIHLKDSHEFHFRKYKTAKELKDLNQEEKKVAIDKLISEFRLINEHRMYYLIANILG